MSSKKKLIREQFDAFSYPDYRGTMNYGVGGTNQLYADLDPSVKKIEQQRQKDLESEIENLNWTMGKFMPDYGPDEFWDQRHTQARRGAYQYYLAVTKQKEKDGLNTLKEFAPNSIAPSSTYRDLPGFPAMNTLEEPMNFVPDESSSIAKKVSNDIEQHWLENALKNLEEQHGYEINEHFCPWDTPAQKYRDSYYTTNDTNGLSVRKDWLDLDHVDQTPMGAMGQVIAPKKYVPDDWELTQRLEYEKDLKKEEESMNEQKKKTKRMSKDEYLVEGTFIFQIMENQTGVYQGASVPLNKPIRSNNGPKKFHVYTKSKAGNIIKVNFGDPDMSIKRHQDNRRESFRARHDCDNVEKKADKTTAGYWSCKMWQDEKSVADMIGESVELDFVPGNTVIASDGIERNIVDHSGHAIIVEYTIQSMLKGKSLKAALVKTMLNFNKTTNMFISSGNDIIYIDARSLENNVIAHVAKEAIKMIEKYRPEKKLLSLEHTILNFGQKLNGPFQEKVVEKVSEILGENPYISIAKESRHPMRYGKKEMSSAQLQKKFKEAQKTLVDLESSINSYAGNKYSEDFNWLMGSLRKISNDLDSGIFENLSEEFKSKAQRNFFITMAAKPGKEGKKWRKLLDEFESKTKNVSSLPDKVDEIFLMKEKSVPVDQKKWEQAIKKAKSSYSVWPSAYASAAASKFYKELGGKWKTVNESTQTWKNDFEDALAFLGIDLSDEHLKGMADEFVKTLKDKNARKAALDFYNMRHVHESIKKGSSLDKWFNKEKWVDISRTEEDGSHPPCGGSAGKGSRGSDGSRAYPVCRPKKEASNLSKSEKEKLVRRKRREENKPGEPDRVNMDI